MRHVLFAMCMVASACVGMNVGTVADCATLCARAAGCGFLPSVLGWDEAGDPARAQANCEWRCGNASGRDETVAAVVECFTAPEPVDDRWQWCDDETDDRHADWSECAAIDRCLADRLREHHLHGDVALTVQVMSFTDYEEYFAAAVLDLYAAGGGEEGTVTSCAPSLCDPERCAALACPAGDCEEVEDAGCDPTLCPVRQLTISMVCSDLGAREITAVIRAQNRAPIVTVFVDASADLNPGCMTPTFTVEGDVFNLEPGPIQVVARVVGELPAGRLVELGLLADPGPDAEAPTSYCLEFLGPPVIAHTGSNIAVVPIGAVEQLKGLVAAGVELRRCDPCPPATVCGP